MLKYFFLFAPLLSFGQNSDWKELQTKIDSAIRYGSTISIDRNYTIDRPLIAANWNGERYTQLYFKMQGKGSMWDIGRSSVITATFHDAPVFAIQCGKGVIVKGITFSGGRQGRDSRFSPQAAVCIDPFSGQVPADGGYPSLREWYRGPQTRSGSTGLRFEDCTFKDATIGFITSPNGYTQNAEIITLENIRVANVKYGIAGCQAQEKMNRIINIANWTKCNVMFLFNRYDAGQPGHWDIRGVNLAGAVDTIIYRYSGGWGPMYIDGLFAESVKTIGVWDGTSGDLLSNAFINFKYKEESGLPDFQLKSSGLRIRNSTIRYYGQLNQPLLLSWIQDDGSNTFYTTPVKDLYGWQSGQLGDYFTNEIKNGTLKIKLETHKEKVKIGQFVLFMNEKNHEFIGQGIVTAKEGLSVKVGYLSPSIIDGHYRISVYEKKETH